MKEPREALCKALISAHAALLRAEEVVALGPAREAVCDAHDHIREALGMAGDCGKIDKVFGHVGGPVCTKPSGHDGDHVAMDPVSGREVSRWSDPPAKER